jgi:spoIIIJ-associated protein
MRKVQASTLQLAYQIAAEDLGCSITELTYEVIQYPSSGIFGLFKKDAIIVATCKNNSTTTAKKSPPPEIIKEQTDEVLIQEREENTVVQEQFSSSEKIVEEDHIVDDFFSSDLEDLIEEGEEDEAVVYDELARLIEKELKELMDLSCFDIDVVEVDVIDNTALIFIDGEDAALLIGKEGYRYNALSYMLFNWLHSKYELFIKLEIAEFLTTQQEMIRNYIKPVIENVEKHGKGKTRFLDGILVQIALEQLREAFPNKYVAVKTTHDGKKFVVINEFKK